MSEKKELESIAQYVFYNRAWMLPTNKLIWVTDTFRIWSDEVGEDGRSIGWLPFQYNRKNGWHTKYKDEIYTIKRLSKIYNLEVVTLKSHPDQVKRTRIKSKKKKVKKKKEEAMKLSESEEIRERLSAVLSSYENTEEAPEEEIVLETIFDYIKQNKAYRLAAFQNSFITYDHRVWCNYIRDDGSQVGWVRPYLKENQWHVELASEDGSVKEILLKTLCNSVNVEFSIKRMIEHPDRGN